MTNTPRIQPAPITGVFDMTVKRFSMKILGEVPEPIGISLHAHNEGLDERKASQVPGWRTSKVFTPLERDVMGSPRL